MSLSVLDDGETAIGHYFMPLLRSTYRNFRYDIVGAIVTSDIFTSAHTSPPKAHTDTTARYKLTISYRSSFPEGLRVPPPLPLLIAFYVSAPALTFRFDHRFVRRFFRRNEGKSGRARLACNTLLA